MSSYSIIQLVTLFVYIGMIVAVLLYARTGLKRLFMVFLVASAGWSLTSFMSNFYLPSDHMSLWSRAVPLFSVWSLVAYAHFVAAFIHRGVGMVLKLGYAWVLGILVLVVLGYCPKEFILLENIFTLQYST